MRAKWHVALPAVHLLLLLLLLLSLSLFPFLPVQSLLLLLSRSLPLLLLATLSTDRRSAERAGGVTLQPAIAATDNVAEDSTGEAVCEQWSRRSREVALVSVRCGL